MDHYTEVWDKAGVLRRLKNREDRLRILVDMFVRNTPERLRRMRLALEKKDPEQLAYVAHEIRGTAGNIGATRIFSITGNIETRAAGEVTEAVATLVASLPTEYDKFLLVLEDYFGEPMAKI